MTEKEIASALNLKSYDVANFKKKNDLVRHRKAKQKKDIAKVVNGFFNVDAYASENYAI